MRKYPFIVFALIAGLCDIFGQPALNDSFFNFCESAARNTDDPRAIKGMENWFFFKPEITHLGKRTFWGESAGRVSSAKKTEWADPLPAIVDFNEQLKKKGIELIFIPVPAKAIVYPDMLKDSQVRDGKNRLDYYHYAFYRLLKTKGVKVMDILPLLLGNRGNNRVPLYCATDTHWSGPACELVADAIAKEIKKKEWYKDIPKLDLLMEKKSVYITGDLVDDKTLKIKEEIKLRRISGRKDTSPVAPRDDSPLVLLGDSHVLVFHAGGDMFAEGAGLADQLAYELGFAVDLIGVRGSGSTASRVNFFRKSKNDPNYLSKKKAVVWCISVREFTESTEGWKLVPITPDR